MITLRDYQHAALDGVADGFDRRLWTLMVMATGLGKTVVFAELIRRRLTLGRALVLVHREELMTQAVRKVEGIAGASVGVEMGERSVFEGASVVPPRVVVASVPTLCRPARLARFAPDAFSTVILDECHHAPARSFRSVLEHFSAASVLGVTATPVRSDKLKLGTLFRHVACDYPLRWGVRNGWLVDADPKVVSVDYVDFSTVRTTAGDYDAADLDAQLSRDGPLHGIARATIDLAGGRPTLVFCAGVKQAEALAAVLNNYHPGSAAWISGATPKDGPNGRKAVLSAYASGRVRFLVNCQVLTEGYDEPSTGVIVLARPFKSLGLITQILGRGTRTLAGLVDGLPDADARLAAIESSAKPVCTVLDFVGSTNELDPGQITAADVFAAGEDEDVRERARQILSAKRRGKMQDALDLAREQVAAMRELEAEIELRKRIKADHVAYRVEERGTIGGKKLPDMSGPATPAQRGLLKRLGMAWDKTAYLTKRQASGIIGRLKAQQGASAA